MANEGLRALLGLQSPSNLSPTGDRFLARRRADIHSGLDEWVPDADSEEFKLAQFDATDQTGGRYTPSRAGLREASMGKLRQMLGVQQQKQMGELATAEAGQRAAMDRALLTQEGQNYRTNLQQGGSSARDEANRASREAMLEQRLGSMETAQAARDAAAMERAQFNQGAITKRTEARQPKGLLDLLRGLWSGGDEPEAVEETPEAEYAEEYATEQPAPRRRGRIISVE